MLFLFENTLTHYIYIVFYTLISRAHLAHNLGNFYAMSRHATPSPRSKQLHTMSNHKPNGIRVHNKRHTIANNPDSLTPMSNHTQDETQDAHSDRNTITAHGVGISLLSRG